MLLSPKNRKKSVNNCIDAPDIVSKRLASNNLLKILYKYCLEFYKSDGSCVNVLQAKRCYGSFILFYFSLLFHWKRCWMLIWKYYDWHYHYYPEASQSVGGIAAKKTCTCWLAAFHLMLAFFFFVLIFLWVYLKIFTYIFTYIYIHIRMNIHTCSVLCEYMHIVYWC